MSKCNFNNNIHQLRGLCALIVFGGHVLGMIHNIIFEKCSSNFFHIFFDGNCAVFIFFAITGFFAKDCMNFNLKFYLKNIVKKLVKLYPPHVIMSIIAFIICNIQQGITPNVYTDWGKSFWINEVTIHDLFNTILVFPDHDTNILNPPIWYLSIEFKAVFILPLLISILNYSKWWLFIPIIVMPYLGINFFVIYVPYLFGALIRKINLKIEMMSFRNLALGVIVGIILLNINNYNHYDLGSYLILVSQSIGAAIIVFSFYNMKDTFRFRFLVFMGTISYEFYLVHFVILLSLRSFVSDISILILLSLAISLILSFIIHKINNIIIIKYENFIRSSNISDTKSWRNFSKIG